MNGCQNNGSSKLTDNKEVFKIGSIRSADKQLVLMVDFGELCHVPSSGLGCATIYDEGSVGVRTQENPDGEMYCQDWHLIVRPTVKPKPGTVHVDAYAMSQKDVAKNRGNDLDVSLEGILDEESFGRIRPLLNDAGRASLKVEAYWSKEDHRRVVMVAPELLGSQHLLDLGLSDGTRLYVYNEWGEPCYAYEGDAIVVTDEEAGSGYRVERGAFEATYVLAD